MPTLILIPGLGSDGAVWRRTIAALGDAADCIVGDTLQDDSLAGMARRVLGQAPERFALAGVSMGGMVSMELMKIAPERVTHLALVDTNARPDTLQQKAYRTAVNLAVSAMTDFRKPAEQSIPSLVHPDTPQDVRDELVEMSVRVGPKCYVRQNAAVMKREDLRPSLRRVVVPTAVIAGADDAMAPLDMSQEIHGLIPNATLDIIPDCGHLPPIEAPQVMAGLLKTLLVR